jgi:hypothetical protein
MAREQRPSVPRYLVTQTCLSLALGLVLGLLMLAQDVGGLRTLISATDFTCWPIFLVGSMITFFPIVMATAIWLLAYDRDH